MPTLPNVPKVIRYDIFSALANVVTMRNRVFMQYSGTLSLVDLGTLLANASTGWSTNMSPLLSTSFSVLGFTGTDLSTPSSPQAVNNTVLTGAVAGSPSEAAIAAIIKLKIARRYRGGHPRFYLPGVPVANYATGSVNQWSSTFLNSLAAAFSAFIARAVLTPPAAVGTLIQVNVSYFSGFTNKTFPSQRIRPVPTLRGAPIVDAVISYTVNPRIGSQRRRNQQSP